MPITAVIKIPNPHDISQPHQARAHWIRKWDNAALTLREPQAAKTRKKYSALVFQPMVTRGLSLGYSVTVEVGEGGRRLWVSGGPELPAQFVHDGVLCFAKKSHGLCLPKARYLSMQHCPNARRLGNYGLVRGDSPVSTKIKTDYYYEIDAGKFRWRISFDSKMQEIRVQPVNTREAGVRYESLGVSRWEITIGKAD